MEDSPRTGAPPGWDHPRAQVVTRRLPAAGRLTVVADEAGRGGRPVLLVHGFTGSRGDFAPLIDPLVETGWHVVAFDNRGHGDSDAPADEAAYTLAAYADDVVAVADALGWDRFVLVGHSLGAAIAQCVVDRVPERVRALVLMSATDRRLPLDEGQVAAAAAVVRGAGLSRLLELTRDQSDSLGSPAADRLAASVPGWRQWGEAKLLACSPVMYAATVPLFVDERLDLSGAARRVTCPALVVVGEQDGAMLVSSRRVAEQVPGARLVVVPDAGHNPQFENPDIVRDAIAGFLADVEAAGA